MRNLDVKQLDEKDEEIVSTLISLGMSRIIARMLAYLQNVDEATSVEIEEATGLHQPEVSIATNELTNRGWINQREEKQPSKGRPYKILSLKIGFDEIIAQLEEHQKNAVDEMQSKIKRLKKFGKC